MHAGNVKKLGPVVALTLLAGAILSGGANVQARSKKTPKLPAETSAVPAPSPSRGVNTFASLRLWRTSVSASIALPMVKVTATADKGKAEPRDFGGPSGQYDFGNYVELRSGLASIEISAAGSFPPLSKMTVYLEPGSARTLIVHQLSSTSVSTEFVDDSPTKLFELDVYNFLPAASGDIQVAMGEAFSASLSPQGGSVRFRGSGRQPYAITCSGKGADAKGFRWINELDGRRVHRAVMVICPDAYGRIRPRLIIEEPPAPESLPPA